MNLQDCRTKGQRMGEKFLIKALWERSTCHENEFWKKEEEVGHRIYFENARKFPQTEEHENPEGKKKKKAVQIISLRIRKALNFPVAIL